MHFCILYCKLARRAPEISMSPEISAKMNSHGKIDTFSYPKRMDSYKTHEHDVDNV